MTFNDVVDAIKILSTDEKQEIQLLLNHYIREERRDDIYDNFKLAQIEQQKGELMFSSNINELRQLIEDRADGGVEADEGIQKSLAKTLGGGGVFVEDEDGVFIPV